MKKMYWQKKYISRYVILSLTLFSLLSLFVVENFLVTSKKSYYEDKITAAKLSQKIFDSIKSERIKRGIKINQDIDPNNTGLLGYASSLITTDYGSLRAKRYSVNPNFAAMFVEHFKQLKLKEGDTIAVAMTGSYPALNISALSAIKTLKLRPLIILSAGASNYGANITQFSWVDIYKFLLQQKYFDYIPLAVSIGGNYDRGFALSKKSVEVLKNTISKAGFKLLYPKHFTDSINSRIKLYLEASNNELIKAYLNVGGNAASIGIHKIKGSTSKVIPKSFPIGITKHLPVNQAAVESVAVSFIKSNTPVINIRDITKNMENLLNSKGSYMPQKIGEGNIYYEKRYNVFLTVVILFINIALILFTAWISRKKRISYKV
jgi:poly-gamma-glutamate system protein